MTQISIYEMVATKFGKGFPEMKLHDFIDTQMDMVLDAFGQMFKETFNQLEMHVSNEDLKVKKIILDNMEEIENDRDKGNNPSK